MAGDNIRLDKAKAIETGLICTGPGVFGGFLLGMDGANDPTITIYDNTEASGEEMVPTSTYDASTLGLNGALIGKHLPGFKNGLYVEVTITGAKEIVVFYKLDSDMSPYTFR